MGFLEKFLGLIIIPIMLSFLILLATGIMRKHTVRMISSLCYSSILVNKRKIYILPLLASINFITLTVYYIELKNMIEPQEASARSRYLETLYRLYRNLLLNFTSFVIILELFYNSHKYHEYQRTKVQFEGQPQVGVKLKM